MMADGVLTARRGEERLGEITLLVAAQAHSGLAKFAESKTARRTLNTPGSCVIRYISGPKQAMKDGEQFYSLRLS
jgi:hypothetical protein